MGIDSPTGAGAGLPSEEEIARAICASDFTGDETVYDEMSRDQQRNFIKNARAILALIRPAFEAKEREIERLTNNRDMWKGQCGEQAETLRELRMQALSDEGQMRELQAKLAQAVEALEPFADFAQWVDAEGWTCNIHREAISTWFGPSDFRRARSASEHLTDRREKR